MLSSCFGLVRTPMQMSTVQPPIVRRRIAPKGSDTVRISIHFWIPVPYLPPHLVQISCSGLCAELELVRIRSAEVSRISTADWPTAWQSVLLAGLSSQRG